MAAIGVRMHAMVMNARLATIFLHPSGTSEPVHFSSAHVDPLPAGQTFHKPTV